MTSFAFKVTPYQGFEERIMQLRNRNRHDRRDRPYLDWRYRSPGSRIPPEIYWVSRNNSELVGMAAVIHRPYRLKGAHRELMVLGDISLDRKYRGTGLADDFFAFIADELTTKDLPGGLVIPNTPARKVLARNGWQSGEPLVHHVCWLNPARKLRPLVRSQAAAAALQYLFSLLLGGKLRRIDSREYSLGSVREFNARFEELWRRSDTGNHCLRNRDRASLTWRYSDRPSGNFRIATCMSGNILDGYLVYGSDNNSTCHVYDIFCRDSDCVRPLLKMFITDLRTRGGVDAIRLCLNETHPYSPLLRQIGFLPRKEDDLFMLFSANSDTCLEKYHWMLTAGDKDV